MGELAPYLRPTSTLDFDHPGLAKLSTATLQHSNNPVDQAIQLYYLVRDQWRYYPYDISLEVAANKASNMLQKDYGHCLDKAVLLASLARGCGIPARLRLAKVKNHIATGRFVKALGTDELVPHGIAELYLDDAWVKLTPAFNKELCEHLNVAPLEFDGKNDSLFQEFDQEGGIFMEYLEDYGHFADLPMDYIRPAF